MMATSYCLKEIYQKTIKLNEDEFVELMNEWEMEYIDANGNFLGDSHYSWDSAPRIMQKILKWVGEVHPDWVDDVHFFSINR